MGSVVRLNDTLQINIEQGFPRKLDFELHQVTPFHARDFTDNLFRFRDKSGIRLYQAPPVRNMLVQNINDKRLYWGLIHVLEIQHDYEQQITSGSFKIIHIYSPEEIKTAHALIDRNPETDYFGRSYKD